MGPKRNMYGTNSVCQNGTDMSQVRVPLADATAMKAPDGIMDNALVLMADIFPTGYFAAHNAFKDMTKEQNAEATVVMIGCGYVGVKDLSNQNGISLIVMIQTSGTLCPYQCGRIQAEAPTCRGLDSVSTRSG